MAISENSYSFLENFIQLIQLWAGICLLFFYLPLLEKSPLLSKLNDLDEKFKNFISSHQVIFGKSDEERVYDPTKWRNFVPRIRNMAALTFFYCVFLLVYIGVERSVDKTGIDFYSVAHPSFLVIANILVFLYVIFCSSINWKRFHQYRAPVFYILAILSVFISYKILYNVFRWLINYSHEHIWLLCCITAVITVVTLFLLYKIIKSRLDWKRFHQKITQVICCIIGIIIFFSFTIYKILNKVIEWFINVKLGHENTWFWATVGTLIVCVSPMIALIIRIGINNIVIKKKERTLQNLDTKFRQKKMIIKEILEVDFFYELSDNAKEVVKPLLSVDEKKFIKNKQKIINALNPTKYRKDYYKKYFDDLNVKELYEDLEDNTKTFIFDECREKDFYIFELDKTRLHVKITSIMTEDYRKEKFEEALFVKKIDSSTSVQNELSQTYVKPVDSESSVNQQPAINEITKVQQNSKQSIKGQNNKGKNRSSSSKKKIKDILSKGRMKENSNM